MIRFVNAKINIGLHITRRRPDGYHELETVFYPVGIHAGTPANPVAFCDLLEITEADADTLVLSGREVDCAPADNLVWRALRLMRDAVGEKMPRGVRVALEKHLPFGAGMGGGSADATFVLKMLNELSGAPLSDDELRALALRLGADCPVFVANTPAYGGGVGELLAPVAPVLDGWWALIVKPEIYISTREAFAEVRPRDGRVDLRDAIMRPVDEWRDVIVNDFEASLFPGRPELARLKDALYSNGAVYASLTGSGAALYGLYPSREAAEQGAAQIDVPYKVVLKL